ncbi:MAG: CotH kinase family protein [Clostridia bacterium]|nr:CotH kinase family protein [Clostridia bacterium]
MNKLSLFICFIIITLLLSFAGGIIGSYSLEYSASALDCPENDGLPVIYIETNDKKPITSKTEYKAAKMTIALNDMFADCRNYYTDNVGKIQIRGRGNSTWTGNNVKHSYRLKLDKKSDLFGFGASKHWILLANYYDPTYLRNKMAYDLSNAIGMWSPESTWVVLYFNGSYAGIYQLCESIRVSKERVDITNWEAIAEDVALAIAHEEELSSTQTEKLIKGMTENLAWITSGRYDKYRIRDYYDVSGFDTTSGYLIEYDAFMDSVSQWYTAQGSPCMVKEPEYLKTNATMFNYIKELVQDFEDAVLSPTFYNSKGKHWSEYVDLTDLVDYWMVQNIMANGEFGIRSNYF